jgi:hypothetical protein
MNLDEHHPLNQPLLDRLRERMSGRADIEPITPPTAHADPYAGAGSHPDVVERVWDELGGSLPKDCRTLVYDTPALVEPQSGVVIALAFGTAYALRVPARSLAVALAAGCKAEQRWTGGGSSVARDEFGEGRLFGAWVAMETELLRQSYEELG